MAIRKAICTITGTSPYEPRRFHGHTKNPGEKNEAFEKRFFEAGLWKDHAHVDSDGSVYIPGIAFKKAMDSAAKLIKEKCGKGQQEWTTHFKSGVMAAGNLALGVKRDKMAHKVIIMPTKMGSAVACTLPHFETWGGTIEFAILDDMIEKEVFERYLSSAGLFVGVGCWRPEKGGMNGRFTVKSVRWEK